MAKFRPWFEKGDRAVFDFLAYFLQLFFCVDGGKSSASFLGVQVQGIFKCQLIVVVLQGLFFVQLLIVIVPHFISCRIMHAAKEAGLSGDADSICSKASPDFFMVEDEGHRPCVGCTGSAAAGATVMCTVVWIVGTAAAMGNNVNQWSKMIDQSNISQKAFSPCSHFCYGVANLQAVLHIFKVFVFNSQHRKFVHVAVCIRNGRTHFRPE